MQRRRRHPKRHTPRRARDALNADPARPPATVAIRRRGASPSEFNRGGDDEHHTASFVGGASVDTSDRSAPAIVTNTGELSFVGGAPVDTSDRAAPAVVVNTTELSFVGR
jgi:hypothetical protein